MSLAPMKMWMSFHWFWKSIWKSFRIQRSKMNPNFRVLLHSPNEVTRLPVQVDSRRARNRRVQMCSLKCDKRRLEKVQVHHARTCHTLAEPVPVEYPKRLGLNFFRMSEMACWISGLVFDLISDSILIFHSFFPWNIQFLTGKCDVFVQRFVSSDAEWETWEKELMTTETQLTHAC